MLAGFLFCFISLIALRRLNVDNLDVLDILDILDILDNLDILDITKKAGCKLGNISRLHPALPDFVIASPKNLHQRVWLFSDALPSAWFGCKPPCSEVA